MATDILEQIAQAVLARLETLIGGTPTVVAVERPLRQGMPSAPRDNLLILRQDVPTLDDDGPHGFSQWLQPFVVDCYAVPSDASTTAVDTQLNAMRAAVEQCLRAQPTLGGLALDLRISEPEMFMETTGAFEGVGVVADVLYRTLEDNPYSQGG